MSMLILLTDAQAALQSAGGVAGPSSIDPTMAALQPVALTAPYQGSYTHILGVEVLTDPAHADVLATLSACPTVDVSVVQSLLPTSGP